MFYSPKALPVTNQQCQSTLSHLSLSISTAIFPGEPGLAGFTGAQDDGSSGNSWS